MKVIHHLYKHAVPLMLSVSEKNYTTEIKNVRMAVKAGPWGVICGPTVTMQCCSGATKCRISKGISCSWFCQP